jgi:TolA-binding protein
MHEVDDELQEIKREIIESRGLVIKTNNLTNALSADIKLIAKRQQTYERKLIWNSAVALVILVAVVLVALAIAMDARIDAIKKENAGVQIEVKRLHEYEEATKKAMNEQLAAQADAAKFYDLIRQNRRADLVRMYDDIKDKPLTKTEGQVFADAVERAKADLAVRAYVLGGESAKLGRWQEAADRYQESLRYNDNSPITPSVKLGWATALRNMRKPKEAIPILLPLVEQNLDKEVVDDAYYLLAKCQTDLEMWNEAKGSWKALLARYPSSPLALEARRLLQELQAFH